METIMFFHFKASQLNSLSENRPFFLIYINNANVSSCFPMFHPFSSLLKGFLRHPSLVEKVAVAAAAAAARGGEDARAGGRTQWDETRRGGCGKTIKSVGKPTVNHDKPSIWGYFVIVYGDDGDDLGMVTMALGFPQWWILVTTWAVGSASCVHTSGSCWELLRVSQAWWSWGYHGFNHET